MRISQIKAPITLGLAALFIFNPVLSAQTRRAPANAKPSATAQAGVNLEARFKQGVAAFDGARYEEAITIFRQIIARQPDGPYADLAYTFAIRSYTKLERFPEANELLEQFRSAFLGNPLVASLAKEIQSAKLIASVNAPALDLGEEGANPFATMAKDAPSVQMPKVEAQEQLVFSSGPVPPPTAASVQKAQQQVELQPKTAAVPPPTGLKTPATDELISTQKGRSNRDRRTSNQTPREEPPSVAAHKRSQDPIAAPLPPEMSGTAAQVPPVAAPQQPAPTTRANQAPSAVPPPTSLKGQMPAPDNTNQPSRAIVPPSTTPRPEMSVARTDASLPAALPMTAVQLQVPRPTVETEAGKVVTFPVLIRNGGSRTETYKLGTTLPATVETVFVLDDNRDGRVQANELSAQMTPAVPPGSVTSVILVMRIPKASNGRLDFQVTINSVVERASPASANLAVITAGGTPMVTVDVEFDRYRVRRGNTFNYTVKIKNNSDLPARMVRLNYTFEEGYRFENAKPLARTFSEEIRTATWDFPEIAPHTTVPVEIRISVLREAEAGSGIIGYGTLHAAAIAPIQIGGAPVTIEEKPAGAIAEVAAVFRELKAAPREVAYIPFIIRNAGDQRDAFDLKLEPFGGIIFADTNRDGVYQQGETPISRTPEITPNGEFQVLVRAETPSQLGGVQQFPYRLVATSLRDKRASSAGISYLTLAVPSIALKRVQSEVNTTSGIAYYELTITNQGLGEAKNIDVREFLIPGSQYINASIAPVVTGNARGEGHRLEWKIASLMPGASVTYRVAVKRNSNTPNPERAMVSYYDTSGNQYAGQ